MSAHEIQMPVNHPKERILLFFGRQRIPSRGYKTTGYFPRRTSEVQTKANFFLSLLDRAAS